MPSQPQTEAPADAPAAPSTGSGLLEGIGKLLKGPSGLLPSASKQDTAAKSDAAPPPAPQTPPAPAAPVAAETQPVIPAARLLPGMVSGRQLCPQVPPGGPDCQTGAARLCQSNGYKSGRSLNIDTSFSCSAKVARATGKACGNEHFVTSAFCS